MQRWGCQSKKVSVSLARLTFPSATPITSQSEFPCMHSRYLIKILVLRMQITSSLW
jgi:hypothetical protein